METTVNGKNRKPDINLASVCGLFCPACTVYIGTHEDKPRLERLAEKLKMPVEELECDGCRNDRRCFFCRNKCKMVPCTKEKGIDFCGSCDEYPCPELSQFQAAMINRIELWESQQRIREAGYETWYEEMLLHYACPECRALNSAPDLTCRKCGNDPASKYAELHKQQIIDHLKNLSELKL